MCVRCGTGRIAHCEDPTRHGEYPASMPPVTSLPPGPLFSGTVRTPAENYRATINRQQEHIDELGRVIVVLTELLGGQVVITEEALTMADTGRLIVEQHQADDRLFLRVRP